MRHFEIVMNALYENRRIRNPKKSDEKYKRRVIVTNHRFFQTLVQQECFPGNFSGDLVIAGCNVIAHRDPGYAAKKLVEYDCEVFVFLE